MPIMLFLGISAGLITSDWCPASILMVIALIGALDEVVIRVMARCEHLRAPQCHHCGYDLTGNISGICPECGSRVKVHG